METNGVQQQFFGFLKENLPTHISLVDDLCDLLQLSHDSVYRRIRGEKLITLNELKTICGHYHVSLDKILQLENDTVLFQAPGINGSYNGLEDYLKGMLAQFHYFNSFKIREMKYLCKDIPFWYFYLYPGMAAFKTFFWMRNIHNDPDYIGRQFSIAELPFTECYELGQQIIREYNLIPSDEVWNLESINSTINQIAYYSDAGLFKDAEDVSTVIDSFHRILDHFQLQAEKGVKFLPGDNEVSYKAPIQYYLNELILGNNTILVSLDQKRVSIITHSVLSYLITADDRFAEKTYGTLNALISRSAYVSRTGEKERNRFFNTLHEKINQLK